MNKYTLSVKRVRWSLLISLTVFVSPVFAASHLIRMAAETLPNGQHGYKMLTHLVGSENRSNRYPSMAVIPGPTLFVEEGDIVIVTLTNNTEVEIGLNAPGLSSEQPKKTSPGSTNSYVFPIEQAGTYLYEDTELKLTGLFGAIIADKADGSVESFIDGTDGVPHPVTVQQLNRQYLLFMVGSTFWGTEIASDGKQTPLWTNPTVAASMNELVRFHIVSIGPAHTFHLHAHRWLDLQDSGMPAIIDTKLMAEPQSTHAFTVKAGDGVGPGMWQYHCHVFAHMEAGMHGHFNVVDASEAAVSTAGASPYGGIFGKAGKGLATFEISDEPGSWFKSTRGDITGTGTKSLELLRPEDSIHFIMSDTNTVHTMTSLIWPTDAAHMPFDQATSYKGGGIVQLSTPGLYVFTCKVHPYMFGAVIVDDPATEGLDLGEGITLVNGIAVPTSSDLATRLLRTFFVATAPGNWQDYTSSAPWSVSYPSVPVRITGGAVANLADVLNTRYGNDIPLAALANPSTPGVGEVWTDTQFEQTESKTKPGTITVIDAATWKIKRKISLPQINMNHPHNMWTNRRQSIIYQTQWFDNKLAFIHRRSGTLIRNIWVGESPAHVMTRPDNDAILVTLNGEEGNSEILAEGFRVRRIIPTQGHGQLPAHPHGHWISADGSKVITPNIFTGDAGVYNTRTGEILSRTPTGTPGAHPIAIGMMPDSSKYYVANLLDSTLSVIDTNSGELLKTINLLADYDPIAGGFSDGDGNGIIALGGLPIQTPVAPDGRSMVTAHTLTATITVVDTQTDTIAAMLPCDPGCHGVQYGAKKGGGYYAYVSSKFSNQLIVVDTDPNNDGNLSDAVIAGRLSLADNSSPIDDPVSGLAGYGGQGVLPIPVVYNGWVQNLPEEWKSQLTAEQLNPVSQEGSSPQEQEEEDDD